MKTTTATCMLLALVATPVGACPAPTDSAFSRPSDGPLVVPFGLQQHPILQRNTLHTGVDFGATRADPVRAAGAGTVLLARRMSEFGNLVSIKHADGLETRYAHLNHIAVAEGDCVGNGTVIGLAGSTGLVDGVQLHFEVRRDDHPLDPLPFLPAAR